MIKNAFFITGTIAFILFSIFLVRTLSDSFAKPQNALKKEVSVSPTDSPSPSPTFSPVRIPTNANSGNEPVKFVTISIDEKRFKDTSKRIGPDKPDIQLIIFGDVYEPFTSRFFQQTYTKLRETYPNMQFVFHYASAVNQPNSIKMGSILECAARQGKFWENILPAISNNETLDTLTFLQQVDLDKIKSCITDESIKAVLLQSDAYADQMGIIGTPTFYLHNKKTNKTIQIQGAFPYETFEKAIADLQN